MPWLKNLFAGSKITKHSCGQFDNEFFSVTLPGRWKWQKSQLLPDNDPDPIPRGPNDILLVPMLRSVRSSGEAETGDRKAYITVLPLEKDPLLRDLGDQKRQEFLLTKVDSRSHLVPTSVKDRKSCSERGILWAECIFTSGYGCWHFFRAMIGPRVYVDFEYDAFSALEHELWSEKQKILDSFVWK